MDTTIKMPHAPKEVRSIFLNSSPTMFTLEKNVFRFSEKYPNEKYVFAGAADISIFSNDNKIELKLTHI